MATQVTGIDKFVSVNGLRLHYLDWGNRGSRPIIMLHGLRGFAHEWDGISRELCDRYHVLALDQWGRGDSAWDPEANYNTDAYISDLEQLIEHLNLDKFILIGHSMGGGNALNYTSKHPAKVVGLVMEDVGPRSSKPSPGRERIAQEMVSAPDEFASWAEAEAITRRERPLATPEALKVRLENTLKRLPNGKITWKYDIRGFQKARANPSGQIDLWPLVRNLQCPTLVLRGAVSDVFSRETAQEMARANPKVQWIEVPNADHYLNDDNPEVVKREVSRFLERIK